MEVDKIYNLYDKTFGSIEKNDLTWNIFIKMLFDFNKIGNDDYLNLKRHSNIYYLNNEGRTHEYIKKSNNLPNIQMFLENNYNFESDLRQIINDVNTIIIDDNTGVKFTYIKTHDKYGFEKWSLSLDDKYDLLDIEEMLSILFDYVIKKRYGVKINDKFLNIFLGNKDYYIDIDGLISKYKDMYNSIFNRYPDEEEWMKFLNYLQDCKILEPITKNQLIYNYGKDGDKTEISNQTDETI